MKQKFATHYSLNFKLNIDNLPSKQADRINLRILLSGIFFGSLLFLLGAFELSNAFQSNTSFLNDKLAQTTYQSHISPLFFDWVIIVLGLGIIASVIFKNLSYKKVFFDGKNITVIKRLAFGKKEVSKTKVSTYQGVLLRIEFVQCGFLPKNRYIIELQSKSSQKNVPLYISTSEKNIRKIWVDYASKLNLPTLFLTDEGVVKREVCDLNKSLKEMENIWHLRESLNPKLKHSFRIALRESPDKKVIKSRKILLDAFNILGGFLVFCIIGLLALVGFHQVFSENALYCLYFFSFWLISFALFVVLRKDKLVIKKDKIVNTHKYLLFSTKHQEIAKNDIKGIYVTLNPLTGRYFLTITSEEKNIIFGKKLPINDLKWIKNYLIQNLIG